MNGVIAAYTGSPFTVYADGSSLSAPGNTQTANQVKTIVDYPHGIGPGQTWFDTSAFAPVTTATFGNSGRNTLRGPGTWNTDLMIDRKFKITERIDTDFRAEFYNLPNTSHFSNNNLDTSVNDSTFGQISSSFGERQIRFGLRLGF